MTNKWVRIAVAVALTVLSVGAAGPLIITNFLAQTASITTAGGVAAALSATLFASQVGAIASRFAGGDDDEVIKVNTRCPKTGTTKDGLCPGNGIGQPSFWVSLIPVVGSTLSAKDHFQNGRWGWGIFHTVMAITDIFLVKALVTAGGKLLVKGGAKILAEEGASAVKNPAMEWLGKDFKMITNPAGDKVFLSKRGLRRLRFDFKRPYPHSNPHMHVDELINGKWVKSGQIYPVGVPPY